MYFADCILTQVFCKIYFKIARNYLVLGKESFLSMLNFSLCCTYVVRFDFLIIFGAAGKKFLIW